MVDKKILCPRCDGSGTWVSSATGVRALTAGEPLEDPTRVCPKCKGEKTIIIRIPLEQDKAEKKVVKEKKITAKEKIRNEAKKKSKEIDEMYKTL